VDLGLPGYAIGGLAVGEGPEAMRAALAATVPHLPADRPRYLMGVGPPIDLLDAIAMGVDLFDCVLPTRNGRRGHLYTSDGPVRIAGSEHERSDEPLDRECRCEVCRRHTRGYLRHLFAVNEHAAVVLGSLHNVTYFVDLVRRAREAIRAGAFAAFRAAAAARWAAGEARWKASHAEDTDGREGSRRARAARDERRRNLGEPGPVP
jgi:queuine tRNA-ribosyltransferase